MSVYNITDTFSNMALETLTIHITPDEGFNYPTSITVTNGTLKSYDKTTGIAVIYGNDTTEISATCKPAGITDLTGTSWVLNTGITIPADTTYDINGSNEWSEHQGSYEGEFTQLYFYWINPFRGPSVGPPEPEPTFSNMAVINNGSQYDLYYFDSWQGVAPLTLHFTGGADATDTDLINWLLDNATLI